MTFTLEQFRYLRDQHAAQLFAEALTKAKNDLADATRAFQPILDAERAGFPQLGLSTVTDDEVWTHKIKRYKAALGRLQYNTEAYRLAETKRDADVVLAGRVWSLRIDVERLTSAHQQALKHRDMMTLEMAS